MTVQIPDRTEADHPSAPVDPSFRWFAIRSLGPRHRPRILAHLLALDARDRYLRFGYAASDTHIGRYVDQLDFERDEVFGVFNRRLELIAMAHLAYLGHDDQPPVSAEFGVSVDPRVRGHGVGGRLFERACLHARSRDIDTLLIHALSDNMAMIKIARAAGATVEHHGSDATARLKLLPDDLSSQWLRMVGSQAGELDYGLKCQAIRIDRLLQSMRDLMPHRPASVTHIRHHDAE